MHQMTRAMNYTCKFTTGDISSSCEMINLRNKSRSGHVWSKLEISEANCGVASVSRRRLSL